jgi:hypothetical protein
MLKNFVKLLFFFLVGFAGPCYSALSGTMLARADSLYKAQRFSAAADLYRTALLKEKKTSRAALLRLAAIEESRNDVVMCLYYLQQFYLLQPLPEVKRKIEEMAVLHKFQGYSIDEADYLYYLYRRYAPWVEKVLFSISLVLFGFLLFRRVKGVSPGYSPIFTLIFLAASAYFLNFSLPYKRAVVGGEKLLFMSGPSSGSMILGTIDRGQRLDWLGSEDVWYQVEWNEKKGWVKKTGLLFFL